MAQGEGRSCTTIIDPLGIAFCREANGARKKLEAAQAREAATLAAQHEAEARLASAAEAEKEVKGQAAAAQRTQEQAAKDLQQAKQACSLSLPATATSDGLLPLHPAEILQLAQFVRCLCAAW